MTTATRLTTAIAAVALTLVLFQGVASLANDHSVVAPQQMAAVATATVAQ